MTYKKFNFNETLHNLLKQIPDGMKTTVKDLSEAMGDEKASGAIAESLKREEYEYASVKVVKKINETAEVFKNFITDNPLKKLAELQQSNSSRIVQVDCFEYAEFIAGVDVAYGNHDAYAACVVLDSDLKITDISEKTAKVNFPYVSGYLAFREAPILEDVVKLASHFDVLMINGHGIAHPRGCGLASQVGIDLDRPTVGIASKLILGQLGSPVNGWSPVEYEGRTVGAMLKKKKFSPIYVSVGHRISLETAIGIVKKMQITGGIPEPIRIAHLRALELKRADETSA